MKKQTINVTKTFITYLWDINDTGKGNDINIQYLRFLVNSFSYHKEGINDISVPIYKIWKDTYSYIDSNGKRKYLMNYTSFLKFTETFGKGFIYNPETKLMSWNFDNQLYFINWDNKRKFEKEYKNDKYIVSPAIKINYDEWEYIKTKPINELKLYFYILSQKTRGQFNYYSITLNDLRTKLLINNQSNKQLKIVMIKYLNDLKTNKIIFDYNFTKYNLNIQKRPEIKK